jgi:tetratricopeptide (TPR) repeat protein
MEPRRLDSVWQAANQASVNTLADLADVLGETSTPERLLRGIVRLERGEHAGARKDFDDVLASQPENPLARQYRGLALWHLGELELAADDLAPGTLFPQRDWTRRALRRFWPLRLEHPEILTAGIAPLTDPLPFESEIASAQALALPRRRALARRLARRGVRAYFAKQLPLAEWCFENACRLDPDDHDAAANTCWVALRIGHADKALALLEPIIAADLEAYKDKRESHLLPTPGLLTMYAWALHETGQHRGAVALLSTMRPEGPDDYHAHIIAGLSWLALDEAHKAAACLDVALGAYLLDTWQQFVEPYFEKVVLWMRTHAAVQPPGR